MVRIHSRSPQTLWAAAGHFQVSHLQVHLWDHGTCTSTKMYICLAMFSVSICMSMNLCGEAGWDPLLGERYRSPTGFGSATMFESVHSGQDQKAVRSTR